MMKKNNEWMFEFYSNNKQKSEDKKFVKPKKAFIVKQKKSIKNISKKKKINWKKFKY